MAYLLVCTGDASGTESYDLALVWISPHQAQASTMEEAIGTPVHLYLQWTRLAVYSGMVVRGLQSHTPYPRDKHLGIHPKGKVKESPYGQISQLEVHQLLSTGP